MPVPSKPTRLKIIEGNPGKRPLNQNEPQPDLVTDVSDVPPKGTSELARDAWAHWTPILRNCGLLTVADIPALTMLCEHWALWQQAIKVMLGLDVEPRGKALLTAEKQAKIVQSLLCEFGMSPSSRSRVAVKASDERDDVEQFLFGD